MKFAVADVTTFIRTGGSKICNKSATGLHSCPETPEPQYFELLITDDFAESRKNGRFFRNLNNKTVAAAGSARLTIYHRPAGRKCSVEGAAAVAGICGIPTTKLGN
jgi:hypothetical protein